MDLRPPTDLRWFVDETSLGIGRALALVRRDVVHPGHPRLPEVPLSTIDTDWMPVIQQRGLVVITRDRALRRRQGELAAFREHGLRSFWIAGEKDPSLSNWLYLTRIVRHWSTMVTTITETPQS